MQFDLNRGMYSDQLTVITATTVLIDLFNYRQTLRVSTRTDVVCSSKRHGEQQSTFLIVLRSDNQLDLQERLTPLLVPALLHVNTALVSQSRLGFSFVHFSTSSCFDPSHLDSSFTINLARFITIRNWVLTIASGITAIDIVRYL